MQKQWCKTHRRFHLAEDVTDSCYVGQTLFTFTVPQSERDAFELGPDGNFGLRLVDGFALEEGRS